MNFDPNVLPAVQESIEAIRCGAVTVQFLSSTAVLHIRHPYFDSNIFTQLEQDPGMAKRTALEHKALRQIREGTCGGVTLNPELMIALGSILPNNS